jgi:hypothetical protein
MNTTTRDRESQVMDLLEAAWGLLANVSDGDWGKQPTLWQEAVVKWRERYHVLLATQWEPGDEE